MPDWLLIVVFAAWTLAVAYLRWTRNWLFYFILGVAGAAYVFIFTFTRLARVDHLVASLVATAVHWLCQALGVPTVVFESAPDVLMVLVITQPIGWTTLQIGVESSGIIEVSVLTALLLFYPGWTPWARLGSILLGIALTLTANTIRVLVIAVMLHHGGKEALVLAHTYVGKLLFFVMMVAIVWALITAPTMRRLAPMLSRPAAPRKETHPGAPE